MMIITYDPVGHAISDFRCKDWAKEMIPIILSSAAKPGPDIEFKVSTTPPISAIRLAIVQGLIPCTAVVFKFEDSIITVNEYGAIQNWPHGFADLECAYVEDILRCAMQKRRRERDT